MYASRSQPQFFVFNGSPLWNKQQWYDICQGVGGEKDVLNAN